MELLIFVVFALLIRSSIVSFDRGQIEAAICARGGKVLEMKWSLLGSGWPLQERKRVCAVGYLDRHGFEHEACFRLHDGGRVSLTDDRFVG